MRLGSDRDGCLEWALLDEILTEFLLFPLSLHLLSI